VILITEEDLNELWNELIDIIQEIKGDVKDNRRAKRHIHNLEQIVNQVGQALTKMAGKRGFLR
jgi:riboflavin synthase